MSRMWSNAPFERATWAEQALAVRIEDEIARRGVKLRGSVDRCGPCPVCGGHDRFSINTRKQVFNCRGCGNKGDVIALVQHLDGCGFLDAIVYLAGADPQRTDCNSRKQLTTTPKQREDDQRGNKDNGHKAAWLWSERRPIADNCLADLYLRRARRFDGAIPATLGYLSANGKHLPAMIAAFGFCNEPEPGVIDPPATVTGVHLTRLTPEGRKAAIDPIKIMLGPNAGLPIILAPVNDGLGLAITEGIECGLSVFEETGLGVWVAGSAGNMPKIAAALPPYIECVTIFAHCDETGLRHAKEAARLIAAMDIEVHIKGLWVHPVKTPSDIGDFR